MKPALTSTPTPLRSVTSRQAIGTDRMLTVCLAGWCLVQAAAWLPGYLTWPWWADHDVFATLARGWSRGLLPYRDLVSNNLPGTIYLFWVLGNVGGWGNQAMLWIADAALLGVLAGVLLWWSRRTFGAMWPGLIGVCAVLGYYCNLDYSQAAQRDWHAPVLGLLGLLGLLTLPRRTALPVASACLAAALLVRPQCVLLTPAYGLAACWDGRVAVSWRRCAGVLAAGVGWLGFWTLLGLAPLVRAGLLDDFAQGVRLAAYGGGYSQTSVAGVLKEAVEQLLEPRIGVTAGLLLFLGMGRERRRLTLIGLTALLGVWLYKPLSPVQHAYLSHPLTLVWAWNVAILAGVCAQFRGENRRVRLAMAALVFGLAAGAWPRYCNPAQSLHVARAWLRGEALTQVPLGYAANPEAGSAGRYDWDDYRLALEHLRVTTGRETRVANALNFTPAVNGPLDRLPALPAESIAWLTVVQPGAEARFVRRLEACRDSVVIWDPEARGNGPGPRARLRGLERAIRAWYIPDSRFGSIEIWRRRPEAWVPSDGARPTVQPENQGGPIRLSERAAG